MARGSADRECVDELALDDGWSLPGGELAPSQVLDRPFTSLEDFSGISNMIWKIMHYLLWDGIVGEFVDGYAGDGAGSDSRS
jgi:hypothetical protein